MHYYFIFLNFRGLLIRGGTFNQSWALNQGNAVHCSVLCTVVSVFLFFFTKGQPLQFVVTVLSHSQASSSADSLSYYHLTPKTLDNVTVVMGTPHKLVKGSGQPLSTQESKQQHPKYSITDLG